MVARTGLPVKEALASGAGPRPGSRPLGVDAPVRSVGTVSRPRGAVLGARAAHVVQRSGMRWYSLQGEDPPPRAAMSRDWLSSGFPAYSRLEAAG